MIPRHPLYRRVIWNPLVVAVPFAYLMYRTWQGDPGPAGWAGVAFIGLWFALSVYDALTSHRWLDILYGDEPSPPVEPE
ncbi:MAG: hypothetical protein U0871_24000 [Gemmataceae bacterium]